MPPARDRDTWSPDDAWGDDAPTRVTRRGGADAPDDEQPTRAVPDDVPTRITRRNDLEDEAATRVSGHADPTAFDDAATRVARRGDDDGHRGESATEVSSRGAGAVVAGRGPAGRRRPTGPVPRRPRPASDTRPRTTGPGPRRPDPLDPEAGPGAARDGWPGRGTTRPQDERVRRRRPVPVLIVALLALAGAGLLGWMGQTTTAGAFRGSWEFSRLGGPWLVAGFVGGAIGGWRRGAGGVLLGIVAGAVIVGAGSVAYYGLSYWDGGNDARRAATLGIGWGAAGVGVGGALGLVGALYATGLGRHRREDGRPVGSWIHGLALGTLGGLLMGESIALLWVWDGEGLRAMAVLEGLGGAALVAFGAAARSWRFILAAVVAAAVSATVAPIATTALRETLRTIGWAGA